MSEVRRDPTTGRWLPGTGSPNPDGRLPVPHNVSDQLRRVLDEQAPGLPEGTTNARAIALAMVAIARRGGQGAVEAARWISDRVEGRPAQTLNVSSERTVNIVPWLPADPRAYAAHERRVLVEGEADGVDGTGGTAVAQGALPADSPDEDADV